MQPDEQPQTGPGQEMSMLERSQRAFYRNLPELLKKHEGRWVAYHGDELLGFSRDETSLYQRCLAQGLKEGEFWTMRVEKMALYDELPWVP